MTRNVLLLILRLVILVESVPDEVVLKYLKEMTATNDQRSLVVVHNNKSVFDNFSAIIYSLELPAYNIHLSEVKRFNGKYDDHYDIRVTFEESKLYFILVAEVEDLYLDLALIRRIYFWKDRDRVVVLVSGAVKTSLKPIFLYCFQFYIINVVFVFVGADRIESLSYNPFAGNYSLPVDDPRDSFPDKYRNMYGSRLKISMFPSVVNTLIGNTYSGRDGVISRTIAEQINATYTYILPRITQFAPVINQYDDVAERVADVGFNTRYVKFNFRNLIEKTYPHDRDDLACLVPETRVKKFTGLASILSESVWILSLGVSLFFFVYVVAFMLIRERRRFDVSYIVMMILCLLFDKPVKDIRSRNFRTALLSYMLFCFFLNTLMLCRLTSIYTTPARFHYINTVKQLADSNYEILTIDRFHELLNASLLPGVKNRILPRLTIIEEEQYLGEIRKRRSVAVICKDHLANYAVIQKENFPNGVQFYRIMKERIWPALSCYIVSYGSPFLHRLDAILRRMVESGINDYWKARTWRKLSIHQFRFNRSHYGDGIFLTLDDIWIGVQVLFIGLGNALIVFLLELLSTKTSQLSKVVYWIRRKK